MKIVLAGGSGQVGTLLARAFHAAGNEAVVLSRNEQTAPWRVVTWDGSTPHVPLRKFERDAYGAAPDPELWRVTKTGP